jgi:8-oxo-dGTP pyrophosphatase MutT (NUDIX family)
LRVFGKILKKRAMQQLMWWTQAKFVVAVVVVVFYHDSVLLLEHSYRPRYPWGLPTGWVQYGETLEAAARREVWEEAQVTLGSLHWLYETFPSRRHLEVAYWAEATQIGTQKASLDGEITAIAWTPWPGTLPDTLLPTQRNIIHRAGMERNNSHQLKSDP